MNDDWGCIGPWNKNFPLDVVLGEGQLENTYLACGTCAPGVRSVSLQLNNDGPLKTLLLMHKLTPVSYSPFM